ncbi:MAG TPA: sporulation protein YabP, partial [Clostridium sp.]|nr:sporulation protein YabP [Clostridium sp.]
MEEKVNIRPHRLTIENRGSGTMTGIREVVSFDENQVVLDTDMGLLTLKG